MHSLILVCVLVLCEGSTFSVDVDETGGFEAKVDNSRWLASSETRFHLKQHWFVSGDTLVLKNSTTARGRDVLGEFTVKRFEWSAGGVRVSTAVRDYTPQLPLAVFEQTFPDGASGCSLGDKERVLSAFPSLSPDVAPEVELGYMVFYNQMLGGMFNGTRFGRWRPHVRSIAGGTLGGPMVFYDKSGAHAVVLSSWQNFLASATVQSSSGALESGILGSVTSIPAGYSIETCLFYGKGVNRAVSGFGRALRRFHGTRRAKRDISLTHLGYYTDNGAWLYYNTYNNMTPSDSILEVQRRAVELGIPFQYLQLDSWWYYKGAKGGVTVWNATPSAFPEGLQTFFEKSQWPVVGHNRYWSAQTPYAKQNGGQFDFVVEESKALPVDDAFWPWLLKESTRWGLAVYEQDWLHNEWEGLNATLTSPVLARQWLLQMGTGAEDAGIPIQYCMAYSRFALASVEVNAVNQARVSDDYYVDLKRKYPHGVNLDVGTSSMLAHALDIVPVKDTFWSRSKQPGYPAKYGAHVEELYPSAHAAIATLSTGPVAPGDAPGMTDAALVMRSCRKDGLLLRPSRPAMPPDAYYLEKVFPGSGPSGELYTTVSTVSNTSWYTLIALDLAVEYVVHPELMELESSALRYTSAVDSPAVFNNSVPLKLDRCDRKDFSLWHFAPFSGSGWVLLGDLTKWVPVASQRFLNVIEGPGTISAVVEGVEGETVPVSFAEVGPAGTIINTVTVSCSFPLDGTMVVQVPAGSCE